MAEDKCTKVEAKDHIAAYLEKRELVRGSELIQCDGRLLEKLTSNYIIVKKILSNLSWQQQIVCKCVCRMWYEAVCTLQREDLAAQDFVVSIQDSEEVSLKKSGTLSTEPLAILTFTNISGFSKMAECGKIVPSPCKPICDDNHWIVDCIDQELSYPNECMLILRASYLSYMPLAISRTASHIITKNMLHTSAPQICGMYIPKIPEVEYHVINIKTNSNMIDMKKDFFDVVNKMSETRIFKGFLVFVTDKYLLNSVDDIVFLNHFKEVQPSDPYALGGCIIEDAVNDRSDLHFFINNVNNNDQVEFVSENVVSIATFSVPKDRSTDNKCNFEMYSLVIESSDWTKPKIQKAIKEFSENVPRFEHSTVFKLSCVGRDERHEYEQDTFRSFFPNTPLVGCYGNGELGVNHPQRSEPKAPLSTVKRYKRDSAQFGIMYSYSTVFVYVGWGKMR